MNDVTVCHVCPQTEISGHYSVFVCVIVSYLFYLVIVFSLDLEIRM